MRKERTRCYAVRCRCKIVHPRTQTIRWTTCLSKGRDAPLAAYQRLLRVAAWAVKESSGTRTETNHSNIGSGRAQGGTCYSAFSFSFFTNALLKALQSDQASEQPRSSEDVFGTTRRPLDSLEGFKDLLLLGQSNSEPLTDDVLLQALEGVLQLCAGAASTARQAHFFLDDEGGKSRMSRVICPSDWVFCVTQLRFVEARRVGFSK